MNLVPVMFVLISCHQTCGLEVGGGGGGETDIPTQCPVWPGPLQLDRVLLGVLLRNEQCCVI